jgi:hypothetical protein
VDYYLLLVDTLVLVTVTGFSVTVLPVVLVVDVTDVNVDPGMVT